MFDSTFSVQDCLRFLDRDAPHDNQPQAAPIGINTQQTFAGFKVVPCTTPANLKQENTTNPVNQRDHDTIFKSVNIDTSSDAASESGDSDASSDAASKSGDSDASSDAASKSGDSDASTKNERLKNKNKSYQRERHDKIFDKPSHLKDYKPVGAGEKLYPCTICDKSYMYRGSLSNHMQTHKKKKFQCELCNKMFNIKSSLINHLKIHSGENKVECDKCGKELTKVNLKQHLLTHSIEKLYECEKCGKKCKDIRNMKKHSKIHSRIEPYKCEVCGEQFKRSCYLKNHLLKHSEDKTFECKECGQKFKHPSSLSNHKKRKQHYMPFNNASN